MKREKARTTVRIVATDCASSSISRIGDRTEVAGSASSNRRIRSVSAANALIERAIIDPSPNTAGSVAAERERIVAALIAGGYDPQDLDLVYPAAQRKVAEVCDEAFARGIQMREPDWMINDGGDVEVGLRFSRLADPSSCGWRSDPLQLP